MEDDFTRILQFRDSSPRCVESYRYEDDASYMSSFATYQRAPYWLILTATTEGFMMCVNPRSYFELVRAFVELLLLGVP